MAETYDFSGKTCIVTGGASGMGKEFARALAGAGAQVVIADINREAAHAATEEIGCSAVAERLDVVDTASVRAMADRIIARCGKIDVLVNSAGIGAKPGPGETAADIWKRVLSVNLDGVYNCCVAVGETMVERKSGVIVNMGSMSATIIPAKTREGRGGEYGLFAYCASKGAVRQLTRALAVTWAPHGVRVNCVSPGYVDTPLTSEPHSNPAIRSLLESKVPMGCIAAPKDIVGSILFLASGASGYITGHDLIVDGGYTCW
ncbi:MAG TPA: SDR family oxidoreductase [Anaerovoracaceae bacterium]|nr:SDR family oxidoreductase [Anaerovoracaceae bacterium]